MVDSSFSSQGVSVTARHFFGVNKNVRDCLHVVSEGNAILYVAGHNIVIYKLDEQEQHFMPGKSLATLSVSITLLFICTRLKGH